MRPTTVVAVVFAAHALAAALPLIGHSRAGAVIGITGFGLGFGVATIARPAMLAARYGTTSYATISGLLTVPMTIAKAGAPLVAALMAGLTGGYPRADLGRSPAPWRPARCSRSAQRPHDRYSHRPPVQRRDADPPRGQVGARAQRRRVPAAVRGPWSAGTRRGPAGQTRRG
jgi:hypothetical protein